MKAFALLQRHRSFLRLASLQFMSIASIGMTIPYVNLFLVDSDFSATQIGTLASIGAVLTLSITPWLNHIADKHQLHRRLFVIYLLTFALANIILATSIHPLLLSTAVLLINLSVSPSITLGMQLTITKIADQPKTILGQIRSFAALGFGLASLLTGTIFSWGGYAALFWTSTFMLLITMQIATIFPSQAASKAAQSSFAPTKRNRGFYVLIASRFFTMMGVRNMFNFLFVHLMQNLGLPTENIGFWVACMAILEVPFFILADRLLPRIPLRLAHIVSILGVATFIILTGMTQSLYALFFLFLLRAPFWAIFDLSAFRLTAEISHPHNVATNQALVQVTMPSIALLLTGSLFGWIFDTLSTFTFFTICAAMCVIGAVIMIVFYRAFEVTPAVQPT